MRGRPLLSLLNRRHRTRRHRRGESAAADGTGNGVAGPGALVSASGLSVGYSDQPVCAPATFTLLPGRVLTLVGVNGAGKSTLLRTC